MKKVPESKPVSQLPSILISRLFRLGAVFLFFYTRISMVAHLMVLCGAGCLVRILILRWHVELVMLAVETIGTPLMRQLTE